MDIKAKIEELVDKIKNDKDIKDEFKKDPVAVVEKLAGVDIPEDKIDEVVDAIKAKVKLDDIGDKLGGIGDKIGGLFGKKD